MERVRGNARERAKSTRSQTTIHHSIVLLLGVAPSSTLIESRWLLLHKLLGVPRRLGLHVTPSSSPSRAGVARRLGVEGHESLLLRRVEVLEDRVLAVVLRRSLGKDSAQLLRGEGGGEICGGGGCERWKGGTACRSVQDEPGRELRPAFKASRTRAFLKTRSHRSGSLETG